MKNKIDLLKQNYYPNEEMFNNAFEMVKKLIGSEIRGVKIIDVEPLYFSDGPIGVNVDYLLDGNVDEFLFNELINMIDGWYEDDSTWQHIELLLTSMN